LPKRTKIEIAPSFPLALALWGLVSPGEVVLAVLLAALLHEAGHLAALRAFGVRAGKVRLGALGAVIKAEEAHRLSYGDELLVTLAGPAVNLILAPLLSLAALRLHWPAGYLLAGAQILLGAFNLLPIPPLDGGSALRLGLSWCFGPLVGDAVSAVTGAAAAAALTACGAYLTLARGVGGGFLLASGALLLGVLPQLPLAKYAVRV